MEDDDFKIIKLCFKDSKCSHLFEYTLYEIL